MRSLETGLGLLRQFTAEQPERGISELARGMHVSSPTAHRYASTYVELGYLEKAPKRLYRLTRRSSELGIAMLGSFPLSRYARPILRDLRRQTGRTVSLSVLNGTEVLYLQRLCGFQRGQYELDRGLGAGSRLPAGETAAGQALTARIGETASHDSRRTGHRDLVGAGHRELFGELVVEAGGRDARALGLAIVVDADDGQAGALEITVPAQAMSAGELTASLGGRLRSAGEELHAALLEEGTDPCITEIAS
jgi:DNA-binding IclR family transcriptional regulator